MSAPLRIIECTLARFISAFLIFFPNFFAFFHFSKTNIFEEKWSNLFWFKKMGDEILWEFFLWIPKWPHTLYCTVPILYCLYFHYSNVLLHFTLYYISWFYCSVLYCTVLYHLSVFSKVLYPTLYWSIPHTVLYLFALYWVSSTLLFQLYCIAYCIVTCIYVNLLLH